MDAGLKYRYEREEQIRQEEKIKQKTEQLESLKRRVSNFDGSTEEYILALEKQLKLVQNEVAQIEPLRRVIDGLKAHEDALNLKIEQMQCNIDSLNEDVKNCDDRYEDIICSIKDECRNRIHSNVLEHEEALRDMELSYSAESEKLYRELRVSKENWLNEVSNINARLKESQATLEAITMDYEKLESELLLTRAKLKAVRVEQGLMTEADDFTDKESFDNLEKEFSAFFDFYESQWGKAKKKIRKKILNYKNLKG